MNIRLLTAALTFELLLMLVSVRWKIADNMVVVFGCLEENVACIKPALLHDKHYRMRASRLARQTALRTVTSRSTPAWSEWRDGTGRHRATWKSSRRWWIIANGLIQRRTASVFQPLMSVYDLLSLLNVFLTFGTDNNRVNFSPFSRLSTWTLTALYVGFRF